MPPSRSNGGMPALGSATRGPSIFSLRTPWGAPRFYPVGEHPATYRLRRHREKLSDLLDRMSPFSAGYYDCCAALGHVQREIDAFDAGELEAMRREWDLLRDREPRS